ncbi:hypothetical protein FGO68_gene15093 [Halteria grandinella]|uniref:Uncharacterized protein n=1 Tax=Halteria grandinella TaxID=5974 RepID=A0A8J8P1R1_HALGN|nr:hypothetical protein FGO68_gene15093 [Halteria grandinella]
MFAKKQGTQTRRRNPRETIRTTMDDQSVSVIYPDSQFREVSLRPQLILHSSHVPDEDTDSEEDHLNWFPHFADKERQDYINKMNRRKKEVTEGIRLVPFGFEGIIRFNQRANANQRQVIQQQNGQTGFEMHKQGRKEVMGGAR